MFPITVFDLLANASRRRPEHCALSGARSVTYGALEHRVRALAAGLASLGVERGDRVVIHLCKEIEEVVATFAVAALGAIFVNVNQQSTLDQLTHVVADSGAGVILMEGWRANAFLRSNLAATIRHVVVNDVVSEAMRSRAAERPRVSSWADVERGDHPPIPVTDADVAAILYTSGSSGRPKGVVLTHRNIVAGAQSVATYLRSSPSDVVLGCLPMSFDYGMNQVMTTFLVGATLVLQPSVLPLDMARALREHEITGLAGVPTLWIPLVRHLTEIPSHLPHLRYVTNSGGALPKNALEAMPRVFPATQIFLMYGLTEAFRSTYLDPELFASKMGAIGRAIPNAEIFVVDPEKGLRGPGEEGELLHRGPLISRGYWGRPEDTNEKLRPCVHLRHLLGEEPVLHSGDTVRIDEDGVLWYVGRNDALIKSSGHRISPTEVEDACYRTGLVDDAVAFGAPDDLLGQAVHVAVSPHVDDVPDEGEIRRRCARLLPTYMVPKRVHVLTGAMPRTPNGKLDRPAIIRTCTVGVASVT